MTDDEVRISLWGFINIAKGVYKLLNPTVPPAVIDILVPNPLPLPQPPPTPPIPMP